jgi:hypothetical protein
MLTQERLKELLDYSPETGEFRWQASRGGVRAGDLAGCADRLGYLRITIDGRRHSAARLAFLWMVGAFPVDEVDHRNQVKSDNRWSNLRNATRAQNQANKGYTRLINTELPKGVHRTGSKFGARLHPSWLGT